MITGHTWHLRLNLADTRYSVRGRRPVSWADLARGLVTGSTA